MARRRGKGLEEFRIGIRVGAAPPPLPNHPVNVQFGSSGSSSKRNIKFRAWEHFKGNQTNGVMLITRYDSHRALLSLPAQNK